MWTIEFWKDAVERAIKTAAQTAISGVGAVLAFNQVPWAAVGWTVLLATVLSLLTSIASAKATGTDSASLANPPQAEPRRAADPEPEPKTVTANADGSITTTGLGE